MCRRSIIPVIVTISALVLALPFAAYAAVYSNASLKGNYSFLTMLRTANTSTPSFAMLGIVTFDGAGNVSVTDKKVSEGGVTVEGPFTGTYSVNADGLGTISVNGGQAAILLDKYAAPIATDVQLLSTNDTSNEIVSGHAVLQATTPVTYDLRSAQGTFFVTTNVFSADPALPQAQAISVETLDGKGHLRGAAAQVSDGVNTSPAITGTYTVNTDGTGTSMVTAGGSTGDYIFVINSQGIMAVQTGVAANLIVTIESHR